MTKTSDQSEEFYTGLTARPFKLRFYEHQSSFRHAENRHKTTLSKHIWKLRDEGEEYTLKWWVIDRGKKFNPISKSCDLCLKEKYHIMFKREVSADVYRAAAIICAADSWRTKFQISKSSPEMVVRTQ